MMAIVVILGPILMRGVRGLNGVGKREEGEVGYRGGLYGEDTYKEG